MRHEIIENKISKQVTIILAAYNDDNTHSTWPLVGQDRML